MCATQLTHNVHTSSLHTSVQETDGQYESIPCSDPSHDHNGIAGGFTYGIAATEDFNRKAKALGAYQTGAVRRR